MKLKRFFAIALGFILSIGFISCENDEEKRVSISKPSNFLDQETIIEAMVDFRIAEASIRQMASKGENTYKITPYYYEPMLQKYHITIEDYHENLKYYAHDPKKMDEIYKEVVNRLIQIQTEVRSQ